MRQDLSKMVLAVEVALDSAQVPAEAGAVVALVRRYARLMDEAASAVKYRRPLETMAKVTEHFRNTINMTPTEDRGLSDMVNTITVALGEHSVASDLGPKILAALTALNMTLAGRAAPEVPKGPTGEQSAREPTPLERHRAEAARLRSAG